MSNIPVTAIVTLFGSLAMAGAWYSVGQRINHSKVPSVETVRLFRSFFGFMSIFFAVMTVPYIWLATDPGGFGLAAAVCYTLAHIFAYVALIYLARMTCTILPRLNKWEWQVAGLLGVLALVATVMTGATMIGSTHPSYSSASGVTDWHAAPSVGGVIILLAVFGLLIPMVLFLTNAFRSHGANRLRSLLLAVGLLAIAIAGPLNDNANTLALIMFANILDLAGLFILTAGVMYQIEQDISVVHPKVVTAPTNTV